MLSLVTSGKQFRAQLGFCKVKRHVQTERESHDLNMDFCSFDNGSKQPRISNILCKTIGITHVFFMH